MTTFSPLLKLPLIFFKRWSEKTSHDPPPGLLAVPLTDNKAVGAVVPMPTWPAFIVNEAAPLPVSNNSFPVLAFITISPATALLLKCPVSSANPKAPFCMDESNSVKAGDSVPVVFPVIRTPSAMDAATTSTLLLGLAVPIPTLPEALISIELVGAPGRMRKGKREPPVTSRTKKLASLPATSHVCAVNPPALVCSYRWAGVLLVVVCKSNTGVPVRSPTRPVLSTKIALVGALPVMVNGTVPAVISSIENLLAPPLAESFAVSCQSWLGKPAAVEVSSNLIRVLFSFSRIVSNPKLSLLTQSSPTQALPCTIKSSGIT